MFPYAYRLPFTVMGIPIQLDPTFLIVLPLWAWLIGMNVGFFVTGFNLPVDTAALMTGPTPYLLGLSSAVGAFASVLAHELGHAAALRRYRVKVKSITLWLLGGMAQLETMPKQKGAEAVVAITGPLTSILLAACFFIGLDLAPTRSDGAVFIVSYLVLFNIVMAVFNLIPALPLDGGRILRSLLALRVSNLKATRVSAVISLFFAGLLALLGAVTMNFFFLLIAGFIFTSVGSETRGALTAQVLEGVLVSEVMTRQVSVVSPRLPAASLLEKVLSEGHTSYPVVDEDGLLVGIVEITQANKQHVTVNEVMTQAPHIPATASAASALSLMRRHGHKRLVVTTKEGAVGGILSKSDLMRVIEARMAGENP